MAILIQENTKVLVQGITGKEGQRAAAAMIEYGVHVAGGVRPGKGGETVLGRPVFDSVREALDIIPDIAISIVYVPPFAAKDAILEAIEQDIPQINIFVERIPIRDTAYCIAAARERKIRLIGPSSLGYISPGVGRIGVIGGPKALADEIFVPGSVGIISRSGGMTNEVAWQIRHAGLGQSTAVHVGGDLLLGTTYRDLLTLFEHDPVTRGVVIFGEYGGSYEFEIVEMVQRKEFIKPIAVYIGGQFASRFPAGMNIGHAGAIVERGKSAEDKERALLGAGVMVAKRYEELVDLIKPHL